MKPIKTMKSKTVVVPVANIDTDQIIPARFLKATDREGMGKACFADWKDRPSQEGGILVAGDNFGCGSSREHAVWALMDYGYRAVVSTSIADIFRNNSLKNGLLPVVVDEAYHRELTADPGRDVTIDLEAQTIDGRPFEVDAFSRYRLLRGMDEMDVLRDALSEIESFEKKRGDVV